MRLTLLRHIVLQSVALLVLACGSDRAGRPRGTTAYDLVLLHTLGGAEEGPATLSDIRGIVVDPQGRILVLDFATQQIEMFDSSGTHLRTIGRSGAGPGELAKANGLLRAPDGSLWVNDPSNNRFTIFDAEGTFVRSIPVNITGYGFIWEAWFGQDSALYEPVRVRVDTTWTERLQRFKADGTVDTLPQPCEGMIPRRTRKDNFVFEYKAGMTVMPIPFASGPMRIYDRRGHAWCGTSNEYALKRVGLSEGDTLTLTGSRTPLPVTQADRDSVIARIRESMSKYNVPDPDWSRIPATKPVIGRVVVDDSGRVWINPIVAEAAQVWDVYSAEGKPVAVVHSPVPLTRWHPLIVRGDRVVGVAQDSNDVLVVVSGKLQKRESAAGH